MLLGNDLIRDGQMWPDDVRPVLKPQDVVNQTELACPLCPIPFGGVDVPVSVDSEVADFTCGFSLKPAGAAIQGPAMAPTWINTTEK